MQKTRLLYFEQITSQPVSQPAQFERHAQKGAGLQPRHKTALLFLSRAGAAPRGTRRKAQDCSHSTKQRSYTKLTKSQSAKQPKQRDTSEKHFFAWSNCFSMILLAHVVLKPTNLNTFHLLSLRFFIFLKSWFSTKSIACGLLQIQVKLFFFKYQKT